MCCVRVRVYGRSKWWLGGGDVWWCVYAVGMWYVMDVMWDVTLKVIVVVSTEEISSESTSGRQPPMCPTMICGHVYGERVLYGMALVGCN